MSVKYILQLKKYLVIKLLFLLLLLTPFSSALNIQLDINDSFSVGENVYFNYILISDINMQIALVVSISCPTAPVPQLNEERINLIEKEPFKGKYYAGIVLPEFEPQTCTASVRILSPVSQRVEKTFQIITNPSFSFSLKFCKDQSCAQKSKVFVLNENIYLDYNSEVVNPTVNASLKYPDGSSEELQIPGSIKAEQIGTYELDVNASKEGYKTKAFVEQFAVIEQEANIPYETFCNANGVCDFGESWQNCPQDCPSEEGTGGKPAEMDWLFMGGIAVAVIAIAALGYLYYSRKKKESE